MGRHLQPARHCFTYQTLIDGCLGDWQKCCVGEGETKEGKAIDQVIEGQEDEVVQMERESHGDDYCEKGLIRKRCNEIESTIERETEESNDVYELCADC